VKLEHIGQYQLPDGPIENPEHDDGNSDKAIEVVRQWRCVTNLVGRAYEWRNEHYSVVIEGTMSIWTSETKRAERRTENIGH
jgi:hypothetical protein